MHCAPACRLEIFSIANIFRWLCLSEIHSLQNILTRKLSERQKRLITACTSLHGEFWNHAYTRICKSGGSQKCSICMSCSTLSNQTWIDCHYTTLHSCTYVPHNLQIYATSKLHCAIQTNFEMRIATPPIDAIVLNTICI